MVSTRDGAALDEFLALRLTTGQLTKLKDLADGLNTTRSVVVRELIDVAVPTGQPRLLIGTQTGDVEVGNGD